MNYLVTVMIVSIVGNIVLTSFYLKKPKAKKEYSKDASDILHDLTRGPAVVRIERIDTDDIFLRSPRNRS